jgi:hypothetical protein
VVKKEVVGGGGGGGGYFGNLVKGGDLGIKHLCRERSVIFFVKKEKRQREKVRESFGRR